MNATESAEDYRARQRQELHAMYAVQAAEIRAATLTPLWRTDAAVFRVEPFDTNFGKPTGYSYRVSEVSVEVTHYLGDGKDEEPTRRVRCWAQRLTATGKPSERHAGGWEGLPDELAAELLGRAMVA
jgi:hypothetical protein